MSVNINPRDLRKGDQIVCAGDVLAVISEPSPYMHGDTILRLGEPGCPGTWSMVYTKGATVRLVARQGGGEV
jgi:hypothetical protein